jgi:starvation-inducible DNA-binding protein
VNASPLVSGQRIARLRRSASQQKRDQDRSMASKLRSTRNDLGANACEVSVGVLNATLVDAIDLTNAIHMAHWTVKGPHFIGLHQLFETFYNEMFAVTDDLAERIVQLGGTPDGTTQAVGAKTRLAPTRPT